VRAHRRWLARALPVAAAALVQGGYLHAADSAVPRALLLKLLHRDCGAAVTTAGGARGHGGAGDDDADEADSDADEAGHGEGHDAEEGASEVRGAAARTSNKAGRSRGAADGALVAVAIAALGSTYAHAWDLSDVFKFDLAGTTLVWLQLNAPLPHTAPDAAASAPATAASAAAGASSGLGVVLPAEVGRRELSRALQSPSPAVLRTALMVCSATLDRASRLQLAASSEPGSGGTSSYSGGVVAALRARLPEMQVLVALRPKLEAAQTAAVAEEGHDDGTLYPLLLNTMRRYVEVLDQSASGHSGLGSVRFDALKVLSDNAQPIASLPLLVSTTLEIQNITSCP
jgi:hypothetical protein